MTAGKTTSEADKTATTQNEASSMTNREKSVSQKQNSASFRQNAANPKQKDAGRGQNIAAPKPNRFLVNITDALNSLVLIGSLLVIIALSLEIFKDPLQHDYKLYMRVQFWVCIVFLADFFFRLMTSNRRWRFFGRNFIFFIVSIPYLSIVTHLNLELPPHVYYLIRLMPLIRGGYGLAVMVGWVSRSKLTSLLISYIMIIAAMTYFASLIFYSEEHSLNPMVESYGAALWWACMNVTTVGSNIYAITPFGRITSVVLSASGMMMFPIFTAYITNKFSSGKFVKHF